MPFHYNKNKITDGSDSMWTSYSDLFLGLSIVFLLLYVTSSLRQGTDGIRQHLENQKLAKENADVQQQLKIYSTLKQKYMDQEAQPDEKEAYQELMSKLDLLQDEAKEEKIKLRKAATENEKKEVALNKYQQMIRNIMNANMIAKSRIKTRDTFIEGQEETISEQSEEIADLQKNVEQKKTEISKSKERISSLEENLDTKLDQLKKSLKENQISKKKFEQEQNRLKDEAENKIVAIRNQAKKAESELKEMNEELKELNSELADTKEDLEKTEAQKAQALQAKVQAEQQKTEAEKKTKEVSKELAKATENLNARKKIAEQIKKNFEKNGIKADVDPRTGDVILAFGNQYFDTGRADLKNGMRKILEQAVPVYSSSLFEDNKIADKISNVEIIGFASPTYRGKQIDPRSLNPGDRKAIDFNLDLSYNRAKSIFSHVFDPKKMSFKHQKQLLPLIKVTGRSFFEQGRGVATDGSDSFCDKNDCAKQQKVIIKFNLKD